MKSLGVKEFAERLTELLPVLMRGLSQYDRTYFLQQRITVPQIFALEYLYRQGGSTMRALADAMRVGESTVTGLVDRMVALHLVRRERSRKDRRVVHVTLSPRGRSTIRGMILEKRRSIERIYGKLTSHERARYLEIINKLVRELSPEKARGTR